MDSFFTESYFYLTTAGFVQALGALLIAPFFFPIARRLRGTSFSRLLRAYLIFNGCLLVWGCLGHYAFTAFTFGRLYVSADRLVDWYPFIPFGQWVLDQSFGNSPLMTRRSNSAASSGSAFLYAANLSFQDFSAAAPFDFASQPA